MVLSSQAPRQDRPDRGGSINGINRVQKRRRNRRVLAVFLLIALVVVVVYSVRRGRQPVVTPSSQADATSTASSDGVQAVHPYEGAAATQKITSGGGGVTTVASGPAADPSPATTGSNPSPIAAPAAPNPTTPASAAPVPPTPDPQTRRLLDSALQMAASGQPVQARNLLNQALTTGRLAPAQASEIRAALAKLNEDLIFSPRIVQSDPLAETYEIQEGDRLSTLSPGYKIPWELIARINRSDPGRIHLGQKLKVIHGPFHVIVDKSDFRMDLYLGDPSQVGAVYIRSFTVGLGTNDGTPLGRFIVKRGKLKNPDWVNPRTGEKFVADNPQNPIGERWIGIRGLDAASGKYTGFGIHGTIDPDSIGRQASMGCVRMSHEDVEWVYDLLLEEASTVTIVP